MVITDIKTTKRGLNAIFCDGDFLFSIDGDTFAEFSVHKGMELDGELIEKLRERGGYRKAMAKAFSLLSRRSHSKKELYAKLAAEFDADTARAALARAEDLGYINDAEYAKNCVEYVAKRKGMSAAFARRYLAERGIDGDIIEDALCGYKEGDAERARALADKKYKAKLTDKKGKEAVLRALAGRGFAFEDIRAAVGDCVFDE